MRILNDTCSVSELSHYLHVCVPYAVRGRSSIEVSKLDLTVPNTVWFASRDRFLDLLNTFVTIGGTASRSARPALLLNREESGELSESSPEGTIGSSTMPHMAQSAHERTDGRITAHEIVYEAAIEAFRSNRTVKDSRNQ